MQSHLNIINSECLVHEVHHRFALQNAKYHVKCNIVPVMQIRHIVIMLRYILRIKSSFVAFISVCVCNIICNCAVGGWVCECWCVFVCACVNVCWQSVVVGVHCHHRLAFEHLARSRTMSLFLLWMCCAVQCYILTLCFVSFFFSISFYHCGVVSNHAIRTDVLPFLMVMEFAIPHNDIP